MLNVNDAANLYVNNITSNDFASNYIVLGTVLYSNPHEYDLPENTSVNADPPSGVLTTGQFILIENSTLHWRLSLNRDQRRRWAQCVLQRHAALAQRLLRSVRN